MWLSLADVGESIKANCLRALANAFDLSMHSRPFDRASGVFKVGRSRMCENLRRLMHFQVWYEWRAITFEVM
jgi:hypothetical protein